MKKSFCTSGFKEWSLHEVLEWGGPLGFDGVELWMGHIDRYQDEFGPLDKLRKEIQKHGMEIPIISGYTNFSSGLSGEYDINQEFKRLRTLLDVARQLDCPMVRTFAGHIPSRNASPEQWGQLIHNFNKVLHIADQYEVDIAVEVHYNTFVDNVESAEKFAEEVDHPRLKIVFDGANLNAEKINQMDALPILYPWIGHIHLKNYHWDHENWFKSKPVSAFKGDIDNDALIEELENRKYNGFVSLEYFSKNKKQDIKESLKDWCEKKQKV